MEIGAYRTNRIMSDLPDCSDLDEAHGIRGFKVSLHIHTEKLKQCKTIDNNSGFKTTAVNNIYTGGTTTLNILNLFIFCTCLLTTCTPGVVASYKKCQ